MPREDHTPWRKFRLRQSVWDAYGQIVGERERSADLVAYIEWKVMHPDAELPKRPRRRPTEPPTPPAE